MYTHADKEFSFLLGLVKMFNHKCPPFTLSNLLFLRLHSGSLIWMETSQLTPYSFIRLETYSVILF